jgi:hypothetical protein
VANAAPAEPVAPDAEPDGKAIAASVAAVATVSVPATAAIVSLFRFRVKICRSRDKVTLQLVTAAVNGARRDFLRPGRARRHPDGVAGRSLDGGGTGQGAGPHRGGPPSSRALTTIHPAG